MVVDKGYKVEGVGSVDRGVGIQGVVWFEPAG